MANDSTTMNYSNFIQETLTEVSLLATTHFGKVTSTTKAGDNNQVLTEADVAIGQTIIQLIQKTYPDHNIIDEEAGVIDKESDYTWVVDPIDGTSNFANGLPTYGVMLGLLKNDQPIAGGVVLPFFNQQYWAERGQGAWLNSERLQVTTETELLKTLVAYGIDGHQENPELTTNELHILGQIVLGIRNLRSSNSVFDLMMVAQGKYAGFLNRTTKIWDNVAPQIILEEAGALYTDFEGQAIDYSQPLTKAEQNFTVCTAAPVLHQQLQQLIRNARSSSMASTL